MKYHGIRHGLDRVECAAAYAEFHSFARSTSTVVILE